ncbi:DUF5071 domain-containing protein [Metabacillus fastidiosus]|uniref:DUF5071 domain-containing protein n=1 Tax=Metabacillus fastidiosus TaxID=1458 RepID=UPI003D2C2572
MEWVQDMNWPIANDIVGLLLTFPNEIVPLIKDVLAGNDDIWKYWCLKVLIKSLPFPQFQSELIRLAEEPTDGEKLEELDEIAIEILKVLR